MKFLKVLSLILAICLLGCSFIACDKKDGDAESETEASTTMTVKLIIKNDSKTEYEESVICDGTLGNAIEVFCAGLENFEGECFDANGLLKKVGTLTAGENQSWVAYYDGTSIGEAFESIKNEKLVAGKTVVVVLKND